MTTLLIVILVAILLVAALRLWVTANRLDRLHVRTEAAWIALEGALSRRTAITRAAAAGGAFPPAEAEHLRHLASVADDAPRRGRADAENDLTRALAERQPAGTQELAHELADAGDRIGLARRFYNDAVRDTRSLRAVWFTRLFRLAGRAALPDYFEIADPTRTAVPVTRMAARVVLVSGADEVLLFSSMSPAGTPIWFTPGGGIEPGEDLRTAVMRELAEETGLRMDPGQLAGPLWRRQAQFVFAGVAYDQTEFYLAARAPAGFEVHTDGFTQVEKDSISGWRWWTIEELATSDQVVYPVELQARMEEVLAAVRDPGRIERVLDVS